MSGATLPIPPAATQSFGKRVLHAETRIFTERTTRIVAVLWLAGFTRRVVGLFMTLHWPYLPKGPSTGCADFGWVWLSGRFAALHHAVQVFDYASFAAAQADLFGAGNCTVLWSFPYPPTLLFFTYPFGLVPFVTGFVLWNVLLTLFFLGAVYAIVRRANAVIGALAMNPAVINIIIGQTAFLTAGLFGFAFTALERTPVAAGFFIALLTYKPQYGVLIPFALVASRNWRALISATAFSLALAAAAGFAFGFDGWSSFLANLVHRDPNLSPDATFRLQLASVYGILQSAGAGSAAAWAAQGVLVLVLAIAVWAVWSRPIPHSLKVSLLAIASLLASPYVLYYDLCLLVIPFAFLIRDGLQRGFLPGERTIMFLCWEALTFGTQTSAVVICAVLLYLIYRRIAVLLVHGSEPMEPDMRMDAVTGCAPQ